MAATVTVAAAGETAKPLMGWADLLARPRPVADRRISYGPDPLQVVDVWLPKGAGPFPVVVMVHGGCWTTSVANMSIMDWAAQDLRAHGIAVWNIEYRGVDRLGGGYPGTFADAAAAADALSAHARELHVSTRRVVATGHSAGGHLAFWLASRAALPPASPLRSPHPLRITAAISSGGLPDLAAARARGDASCGAETIDRLVSAPRQGAYADTSLAETPPARAELVIIDGEQDTISPPSLNAAFVQTMVAKGKTVRQITLPDTGHVELIAPGSAAWERTRAELQRLLAPRRPGKTTAR